jgi:hypothetical protein
MVRWEVLGVVGFWAGPLLLQPDGFWRELNISTALRHLAPELSQDRAASTFWEMVCDTGQPEGKKGRSLTWCFEDGALELSAGIACLRTGKAPAVIRQSARGCRNKCLRLLLTNDINACFTHSRRKYPMLARKIALQPYTRPSLIKKVCNQLTCKG